MLHCLRLTVVCWSRQHAVLSLEALYFLKALKLGFQGVYVVSVLTVEG